MIFLFTICITWVSLLTSQSLGFLILGNKITGFPRLVRIKKKMYVSTYITFPHTVENYSLSS